MKEVVVLYKTARVQRNISFVVMILAWAMMITLICVGVMIFTGNMTAFMIAGLLVGGAGTVAYFVLNHRFLARERDVCAEILRARLSAEEILSLTRELKLDRKILKIYIDGV